MTTSGPRQLIEKWRDDYRRHPHLVISLRDAADELEADLPTVEQAQPMTTSGPADERLREVIGRLEMRSKQWRDSAREHRDLAASETKILISGAGEKNDGYDSREM